MMSGPPREPGGVDRTLERHLAVRVLTHALLVVAAALGAFVVRADLDLRATEWPTFARSAPVLLIIRMAAFGWFRLFEGVWRYVGMRDVLAILKATSVGSLVFGLGAWSVLAVPTSVVFVDWMLCLVLVGGLRLTRRAIDESLRQRVNGDSKRVLIVGAGDAGEMLLRELERDPAQRYAVTGLVDDDARKQGRRIHGVEVLGRVDRLPELCTGLGVQEILVAVPSVTGEQRQRIVRWCLKSRVPFKTVPRLNELLQGRAGISQLREVRPEDLLGREAVRLDVGKLRRDLQGKRVLITGAAGSIGAELCRQLAAVEPDVLVLFDRSESDVYFTDLELRREHPRLKVVAIVGDILDRRQVDEVMRTYAPDLVYHAAAYKHVPLMEEHPLEAVENNVFGTETLALAAREHGAGRFVLISTDKAVHPVSVMGMTKRVAEGVVRAWNGGPTTFVAVRFGNVLGSDGSVLPLFRWQIATGGPVTVTDREATRYFMLLSEAAQLVLQAGAMGRGGEVFFLDMGEPVRILELANNLVRLSGLEPGTDISIAVTGLRPGERLNETLVMEGEERLATEQERVTMVRNGGFDPGQFLADLEALRHRVATRDRAGAMAQLRAMAGKY